MNKKNKKKFLNAAPMVDEISQFQTQNFRKEERFSLTCIKFFLKLGLKFLSVSLMFRLYRLLISHFPTAFDLRDK